MTNFVPTEFNVDAKRLAELALSTSATEGARPLLVSNPLVEVGFVTKTVDGQWNGTVLPIVDWSATEGNSSGNGFTRVEVDTTLPAKLRAKRLYLCELKFLFIGRSSSTIDLETL
eukprot:SAG31_NODE_7801_length_1594_cov_1.113043_2_plen_115_part_00